MKIVTAARKIAEVPGWRLESVYLSEDREGIERWDVRAAFYPPRDSVPEDARPRTRDAEIEVSIDLDGPELDAVVRRVIERAKEIT